MSTPKLHKVTHNEGLIKGAKRQTYCGPGAISAITGRTAECAAAWINHYEGRPVHHLVVGTTFGTMRIVLSRLGFLMESENIRRVPSRKIGRVMTGYPTFAHWLRSADRRRDTMYLVVAGNHYMVVRGTRVVCSQQTGGNPTGKARNRRALVTEVWKITQRNSEVSAQVRRMRLDPLPTWDARREQKRIARHARAIYFGNKPPERRYPQKHEIEDKAL